MFNKTISKVIMDYEEDKDCLRKSIEFMRVVALREGMDAKSAEDARNVMWFLKGIQRGSK